MMTNEEFVDEHVNDLRDNKLPKILAANPGAVAFMREFFGWAGTVIETAAVLGPEAEAYAKQRVAEMVMELGKRPKARPA